MIANAFCTHHGLSHTSLLDGMPMVLPEQTQTGEQRKVSSGTPLHAAAWYTPCRLSVPTPGKERDSGVVARVFFSWKVKEIQCHAERTIKTM